MPAAAGRRIGCDADAGVGRTGTGSVRRGRGHALPYASVTPHPVLLLWLVAAALAVVLIAGWVERAAAGSL